MAIGLTWATQSGAGQYLTNQTLSRRMRELGQPFVRYRQFTTPDPQFGKRHGEYLYFSKRYNAESLITGAILGEDEAIPRIKVRFGQGTLQVFERGEAHKWNEATDSRSEFDVKDQLIRSLSNSMALNLDRGAYDDGFNKSDVVFTPTGDPDSPSHEWSVNGTAATAATRPVMVRDIKHIVSAFKSGRYGTNYGTPPVPCEPFDGDNFVAITAVEASHAITDDPAWENPNLYGRPEAFFDGETGKIWKCRIVEDNHIAGLLAGTFGGEATVFGKDPVIEAVVTAEEIRESLPDDFGRSMAVAWYAHLGFAPNLDYSSDRGANSIVRVRG